MTLFNKYLLSDTDRELYDEGSLFLVDYQEFCKQGLKPGNDEITFALGLGGETGEVLEIIKKARRDEEPVDLKHLREEIGDVCWYIANLCSVYGFNLIDILKENKEKLEKRYGI